MESSSVAELFLALGLIIAAAQLTGAAARLLGQPRVFGQLLAGVFLGPSLLNFLHWSGLFADAQQLRTAIQEFAELGVLFLMFTVGLEVQLSELIAVKKVAVWSGLLGGVLPIGMAIPVVLIFDHPSKTALYVGVVLSATSVSISAQTLLELGVLRTKEGSGLLASAVVDDIVAILALSIALATLGSGASASVGKLIWILVRMMLYLSGALAVAWLILPRLFNWIDHQPQLAQGTTAFALIAALVFGWSADVLGGVAAITGAFIAGLGVGLMHEKARHDIEDAVHHISYSFLVPIFFVNVGLLTDLGQIGTNMLPLVGLLLLVAVISKVVGGGLGALLGGFDLGASFRLGVCRVSRGEVGLIIASLGLSNGLLSRDLFQPIFLVVLLTTILTPPMVRWTFKNRSPQSARV